MSGIPPALGTPSPSPSPVPPSVNGTEVTSSQPLLWVIIPLLAVLSVVVFSIFVWSRHRKARRDPSWVGDRILMPSGFLMARTDRRWNLGIRGRSVEGLNELGDAPPPYDTKKPPPIDGAPQGEAGGPATELRDLEAAVGPPPGYVPPPPAAHVAPQSRRSV